MLTALVRSALDLVFPVDLLGLSPGGRRHMPCLPGRSETVGTPLLRHLRPPQDAGNLRPLLPRDPGNQFDSGPVPFRRNATRRDFSTEIPGNARGREAVGRTARRIYAVPYARCRCPGARSASPAAFAPAWLQPVGAPGPRIEFVAGTAGGAGIVGPSRKLTASGGHSIPRRTPRERGRGLRRWSGAKQDQSSAH